MKSEKNDNLSWALALEGPDLSASAQWLRDNVWGAEPPKKIVVDMSKKKVTPDWLQRWAPASKRSLAAYWDAALSQSLVLQQGRVVAACFPFVRSVPLALEWLESVPFEVASFGSIHDWGKCDPDYIPPSFSRNHSPHGWGCAFKGNGHERLVSRRWLEYGPWKLWRGNKDVSLVQFHSLDSDAATALAQAKPGHLAMGISNAGGFLQLGYVYEKSLHGLYSLEERMMRIVVLGRELFPIELRDACAARKYQALGPDKPLERIAYVFPEPEEAQSNLHALWLRELECWTIRDGLEVRLDEDYLPIKEEVSWS